MITITRKIEFDAGHRVLGHEGKCANLHGHRYVAEITVSALGLDPLGRVVDFSVVKELIGGWVDQHWDHNIILNDNDPLLACQGNDQPIQGEPLVLAEDVFGVKDPYVIAGNNPTAEVMAEILFLKARSLLVETGLNVDRVRLYETPNCWAEYKG